MPVLLKLRFYILSFLLFSLLKLLKPVYNSEWKENWEAVKLQRLYYIHTQQTINIRPQQTWFTCLRNLYKYIIEWFIYYIDKERSRLLDIQISEAFEKYSPEEQEKIRNGDYYS